jgi:hypothetical protein
MELSEAALDREGEAIVLTGTIHQPAEWAYKVTMERGDWTTVLTTATSAEACTYLSRSVSVARILGMGLWVVKFIVLMSFYRLGSLLGLVDLDRDAEKPTPHVATVKATPHGAVKPTPPGGSAPTTLKAIAGGAVERRNTA